MLIESVMGDEVFAISFANHAVPRMCHAASVPTAKCEAKQMINQCKSLLMSLTILAESVAIVTATLSNYSRNQCSNFGLPVSFSLTNRIEIIKMFESFSSCFMLIPYCFVNFYISLNIFTIFTISHPPSTFLYYPSPFLIIFQQ